MEEWHAHNLFFTLAFSIRTTQVKFHVSVEFTISHTCRTSSVTRDRNGTVMWPNVMVGYNSVLKFKKQSIILSPVLNKQRHKTTRSMSLAYWPKNQSSLQCSLVLTLKAALKYSSPSDPMESITCASTCLFILSAYLKRLLADTDRVL